jgi:hypothetical protein
MIVKLENDVERIILNTSFGLLLMKFAISKIMFDYKQNDRPCNFSKERILNATLIEVVFLI